MQQHYVLPSSVARGLHSDILDKLVSIARLFDYELIDLLMTKIVNVR